MRLTSENALLHFVKEPVILLDGKPISGRFLTEADNTAGYIIIAKVNEQGEVYADGDEIATERLEGIVEFRGIRRT